MGLRKAKKKRIPPIVRGVAAGFAGTAAMTGYQLAVAAARNKSLHQPVPRTWEEAPAPAKVAKNVAEAAGHGAWVTRKRVPLVTNAMHWAYGTTWGALYAAIVDLLGDHPVAGGLGLGTGVWGASYATLVPAGIYEPPWRYPAKELALDLSYHLVYGGAVAATYKALDR